MYERVSPVLLLFIIFINVTIYLLTCTYHFKFNVLYYGLFSHHFHIIDLPWRLPCAHYLRLFLCTLLFVEISHVHTTCCGDYPCVHYFLWIFPLCTLLLWWLPCMHFHGDYSCVHHLRLPLFTLLLWRLPLCTLRFVEITPLCTFFVKITPGCTTFCFVKITSWVHYFCGDYPHVHYFVEITPVCTMFISWLIITSQWVITLLDIPMVTSQWVMMFLVTSTVK